MLQTPQDTATSLVADATAYPVKADDRELFIALGLATPDTEDHVRGGSFDNSAPMQMIAAQREKHSVLSTITALSDALAASAALGPPTPQMENLLAKALDGLQHFINADPSADPSIG